MMKMRGFSKKMNGMLMAACIGLGGLSLSISSLPINAIAAETEAKEEAPQQPAMTAEELEAELSRQPVRFLDAEVCNTNDGRLDTSWNSGWVFSHIINESEEEVQHIKVYFVAWDANNLPVILKSKYLNYTAGYTPDLIFQGANLVPGAILNEDDADTFQVFPYDLTCNVAKAKGIVAAYTTFSGDTWQNPLLGQWLEIYGGGKKLVEPVVYTDEETVTRVQEALNAAGYDCGTPDGKAGPKTFAAMNEYQRQNGLVITNDITDRLLQSLGLAEESDAAPEEKITAETADPDSAEDIKALLQGSWKKENSDKNTMMIFSGDICKMSGAGQEMDFEYTIDTENHDIVLIIKTSDAGDMGARFAYSLDGGVFKFTDKTGTFSKIE